MGFIIGLRGGGEFTMGGGRLIISGELIAGGGGEFSWLTTNWEAMSLDNVGLIKAWESIGFWWLIWLMFRLWIFKSSFCNLV